MFDDKVNNMDSIVGLDERRDSGKSSGNRENDVGEEMVEKVNDEENMENQERESNLGDEIGNNKDKECLDVEDDMSDENNNMKECPNRTNDSDVKYANNKLNFIPTKVTKEICEVVIFDEDLVDKGSAQWKLTVCGHFVGYKMNVHGLRYHLRKMWSKWGIDDIDMMVDGTCLFKFRSEVGMNKVLDLGP
ncbi:RNA-directed DNA polymerase, eukaryota, reverse transcriptase zinc-binding domain protein [Tanacetum coccineum]